MTVFIRSILLFALCTVSFAESTPVPLKTVWLPLEAGTLEVTPYSTKIVRVCFYPDPALSLKESLVVIAKPSFDGWTIKHGKNGATLTSANLQVEVDSKSGVISFADKASSPLLKNSDIPRSCNSNSVGGTPSYRVRETFQVDSAQGLYGLGQYQDGKMNYRNTDVRIMQANKISVNPFLISTANWGLLWDNYSDTQYQDLKGVTSFESEYGDAIDYYIVVGDSMDEVIAGYRHLTGAAPMFGKWAYGFWQCKERYTSFQELKDIVAEYRRRNVPIDNIIQDWRYWGEKGMWSSMEFDPATYRAAEKNIEEIHNLNVKLMVSIWPSLGPDTKIYKEFDEKGYLLDNKHWCTGKVYAPFNPAARKRYWDCIKCGLIDKGVDALWMDGTEPEFTGTGSQDTTLIILRMKSVSFCWDSAPSFAFLLWCMCTEKTKQKSGSFWGGKRPGTNENNTENSYEKRIRLLGFGEKSICQAIQEAGDASSQHGCNCIFQDDGRRDRTALSESDQSLSDRTRSFRQKTFS